MLFFFFFKQKTAYEMRISDWSSDVCSSDLLAKEFYGCDPDAQFSVPSQVREHFSRHLGKRGASAYASWMEMRQAYGAQYPDLADQLDHMRAGTLPAEDRKGGG